MNVAPTTTQPPLPLEFHTSPFAGNEDLFAESTKRQPGSDVYDPSDEVNFKSVSPAQQAPIFGGTTLAGAFDAARHATADDWPNGPATKIGDIVGIAQAKDGYWILPTNGVNFEQEEAGDATLDQSELPDFTPSFAGPASEIESITWTKENPALVGIANRGKILDMTNQRSATFDRSHQPQLA